MYVVMIFFQKFRVHAALTSAAVFLIAGVMSTSTAIQSVNWNILMMISGTMILVHYFIDSKMPNKLADILLDKSKNMMMVIIFMSLFSGFISAFVDNVATVLMVAPVGLAICRKLDVSPSSDDAIDCSLLKPPRCSYTRWGYHFDDARFVCKMDFSSFFVFHGKPGIFFCRRTRGSRNSTCMMILFRKV